MLNVSSRIINAACGRREIGGGGVVDRIHPDRLCADARVQRIDEILTDGANAGRLGGPSGEHHLDIGARVRGRGGHGCDQRAHGGHCGTKETREGMRLHVAILSQCESGRRVGVSEPIACGGVVFGVRFAAPGARDTAAQDW